MIPKPVRQRSGVVVPTGLTGMRRIVAPAVARLMWLSAKSWRRVWKDTVLHGKAEAPIIFCVWHDHLALALASYDVYARAKWIDKGLVAMVSASGDGAFLAAILAQFDINVVRGSTSRRGPQALLEATRWLRKGYSIVLTPDGPRGPARQIQDGVIYLAQVSGRPIVPFSNHAQLKFRLRSWDRFQVPLPFARCELYDADPVFVPRDADDAERERLRLKLEESMRSITKD